MTENICSIIIVEIERIKNQVSIFSKKKKNQVKKKIIHTNKTTDTNSRTQLYNMCKVQ